MLFAERMLIFSSDQWRWVPKSNSHLPKKKNQQQQQHTGEINRQQNTKKRILNAHRRKRIRNMPSVEIETNLKSWFTCREHNEQCFSLFNMLSLSHSCFDYYYYCLYCSHYLAFVFYFYLVHLMSVFAQSRHECIQFKRCFPFFTVFSFGGGRQVVWNNDTKLNTNRRIYT